MLEVSLESQSNRQILVSTPLSCCEARRKNAYHVFYSSIQALSNVNELITVSTRACVASYSAPLAPCRHSTRPRRIPLLGTLRITNLPTKLLRNRQQSRYPPPQSTLQ